MTRSTGKTNKALVKLAARLGISSEYHDIWGTAHPTSDETRQALLAAMGCAADADPAQLLRAFEERDWQTPLPPVLVTRQGSPVPIDISLPATLAGRRHRWILTTENGETTRGSFIPAELTPLAESRLGKRAYQRSELLLPPPAAIGYYRLELEEEGREAQRQSPMTLIVAPARCFEPAALANQGRVFGPTVQLYGLRSQRNWGIGDFSDLRTLVDQAATAGAGIIGVSPLHALFPDQPTAASPYSPSNRCFHNVLYLDPEAIPELAECADARQLIESERFQARLRRLRAQDEVDYAAVAATKREVLELIYEYFCAAHLAHDSHRARSFRQFRERSGSLLENHARFEALQEHFRKQNAETWGWPVWPAEYRQPQASAVSEFANQNYERVQFFAWLQWLCDEQLAAVGLESWRKGLGVGVFQDLALGANPAGSECWMQQHVFAEGAWAGSPPDAFNPLGQNWGLPPFIPHRLRDAAYAPFIAILRANMRHGGALRIDHVMSLARLFWVPANEDGPDGAYVNYPLEDLLAIVALESVRNQCVVVGEDLGTVPEGFRQQLAGDGVLSYHPFFFERNETGDFKPPADYDTQALVAVSTHDLPTLASFWRAHDLDQRQRLGLFPNDELRDRQFVERAQDQARFLMALEREGLLPEGVGRHPVSLPEITPALMLAVHTYLARTPAQLLLLQPEDVLGQIEQANLPGSNDEQHPNWRRRLPLAIEEWASDERFKNVSEMLRRERGSAVEPQAEDVTPRRQAVIPRATYRLQFNSEFTFSQAAAIAPYLAELGISHCYASPYLRARPGSMHGYDIVDHAMINPEIGSPEDFENFSETLKAHDLGQILDVVPNHMGVMGADNAWWLDVLENGPASARGAFFDIDWEPLNPELAGKVLLPLLGDHYGTVLEGGELRLEFDPVCGEFSLFYFQHRLPIDPATYPRIIDLHSEQLIATLGALGEESEHYIELQALLTAFKRLPTRLNTAPVAMAERQRDKEVNKRHLAALCDACPEIRRHIATNLEEFNGIPGEPASFDALHELIQLQGYRLAYWRVASDDINYRRFFDINDLAALRIEEKTVFDDTHRFVLELLAQGKIEGLRIDHPDGLYDPGQYFRRLQQAAAGSDGRVSVNEGGAGNLPLYLVIEKILADHERLPDDWPIHGATGYRFANLVNALFVDSGAERRLTRIYQSFTGVNDSFEEIAYDTKKLIMYTALSSELNVLATRLTRIAAASRETCDFTLNGLRQALVEVVASFPVYRSYVTGSELSADDRRHIGWAVAVAKKHSPVADTGIFDFIQGVLTTDVARGRGKSYRQRVQNFAMKFQQFSSPVMAKGVEDTAFYRYHRLTSLNDVGGEPRRFGMSVSAFHSATRARAARWPHNMLASSTHDSKRSEDVRARVNVISEIPAAWKLMLKRWNRLNRGRKRLVDEVEAPSRNDEYLLYQTLIGAWPLELTDLNAAGAESALATFRDRIDAYMIKALREAKEHSSWANINGDYEAAMSGFIQALLAPGEKNLFLTDFVAMVQPIMHFGLINSLAQTLIKLSSPGVPDIYQGCESWQFNLVDPDNRRPIDFDQRRQQLAEVKALVAAERREWPARLEPLLANMPDGRIKLYIVWQTLALRAQWPEVFRDGDYLPLNVVGDKAAHVCAFARRFGERIAITVVPRLPVHLLGNELGLPTGPNVWGDTAIELPPDLSGVIYNNVLSGERLEAVERLTVGEMLASFPAAILSTERPS